MRYTFIFFREFHPYVHDPQLHSKNRPPTFVGGLMLALSILTARKRLSSCCGQCLVDTGRQHKTSTFLWRFLCWHYLLSRLGQGSSWRSNSTVYCCCQKYKRNNRIFQMRSLLRWHYLFSRPVTRQLSSAYKCLTSVFGMGTGGPT